MKIRMTSIAWRGVALKFSRVMSVLEGALNLAIDGQEFGSGVQCLAVFAIAVDANGPGNDAFCQANHKVDFCEEDRRQRRLSVALPFDPADVELMSDDTLRHQLCEALIYRLAHLGLNVPGRFDYPRFAAQVCAVLEGYRDMECIELLPLSLSGPYQPMVAMSNRVSAHC